MSYCSNIINNTSSEIINYCNNICNNINNNHSNNSSQCLCNCINNYIVNDNDNSYNDIDSITISKIMLCIILFALFLKCICYQKSKNTIYYMINDNNDNYNNENNYNNNDVNIDINDDTKQNNNNTDNTINTQPTNRLQNPPPSYESIIIDLD